MELTFELLFILFAVSILAGFIDSICGGGGLLALPVLMISGLTPAQALATNKLQAIFGKLSSVLYFYKHGFIQLSLMKWSVVLCFIFAGLGAISIQYIPADKLSQLIPWLIGLIALYILFSPRLGDVDNKQRISVGMFCLIFAPIIGFYDGFFGPASGSFFAISLIAFLGFNATKATANSKLLLLVSNAAALMAFIIGGQVVWLIGLVMAIGQWLGARYGSELVHMQGNKIVKPMLLTVCFITLGRFILGTGVAS